MKCPGPASGARALLASRLDMTDAHVACRRAGAGGEGLPAAATCHGSSALPSHTWMSPVVRHRFAKDATHSPQPVRLLQYSTDSTTARPPPAAHAWKASRKRPHETLRLL